MKRSAKVLEYKSDALADAKGTLRAGGVIRVIEVTDRSMTGLETENKRCTGVAG